MEKYLNGLGSRGESLSLAAKKKNIFTKEQCLFVRAVFIRKNSAFGKE